MNIQSFQKRTAVIVLATLIALYEGLKVLGLGLAGIPYNID